MLILIDVPPQPEELKPFLVHDAVVDGRVEGAFISIFDAKAMNPFQSVRHRLELYRARDPRSPASTCL